MPSYRRESAEPEPVVCRIAEVPERSGGGLGPSGQHRCVGEADSTRVTDV